MRGICGRRQRHRFKAMRKLIFQFGLSLAFLLALSVAAAGQGEGGRTLKWKVAIGRFSNETQYGKGIFYERENDPMAKQAYDILAAKLVASNKFILLERADADKLSAELNDGGESNRLAADYLIPLPSLDAKPRGRIIFLPPPRRKRWRREWRCGWWMW